MTFAKVSRVFYCITWVYQLLAQCSACVRLRFSPQGHNAGIFFGSHPSRFARGSRNSVFVSEDPYLLRSKGLSQLDDRPFRRRLLQCIKLCFRGALFFRQNLFLFFSLIALYPMLRFFNCHEIGVIPTVTEGFQQSEVISVFFWK